MNNEGIPYKILPHLKEETVKKIKEAITNNFFLIMIIMVYSLLTLSFLSQSPLIWSDEGLFSENAWHFIDTSDGHRIFRQPLFTGYFNFENFSTNPFYLHFLLLSLSFKLLGVGIFQARLVSFCSGLILTVFFYFFVKKNLGKSCAIISTLFLVCNPIFILSSRIVRPEMLITLFSCLAFICILKGINERKKIFLILSGICVVLSSLSHPNGVYVTLAAFVVIFIKKEDWKDIGFYLIGIIIASIPIIIFISINYNIFITQFFGSFSYRLPFSFTRIFLNVLQEPNRWLTGKTIPISFSLGVFAFIFLISQFKKLKEYYIYLFMLIGSFSLFEYHKYYGYLLLTLPFFCIFSGILYTKLTEKQNIKKIIIIIVALILSFYISISVWKVIQDIQYSYADYCQEIKEATPEINQKNKIILGDAFLWFCFPEGNLRETMVQIKIRDIMGVSFKEVLEWQNTTYIILDPITKNALVENKLVSYGDPRGYYGDTKGYLEAIQNCTEIAEIKEPHNRYIKDKTIIYKC